MSKPSNLVHISVLYVTPEIQADHIHFPTSSDPQYYLYPLVGLPRQYSY